MYNATKPHHNTYNVDEPPSRFISTRSILRGFVVSLVLFNCVRKCAQRVGMLWVWASMCTTSNVNPGGRCDTQIGECDTVLFKLYGACKDRERFLYIYIYIEHNIAYATTSVCALTSRTDGTYTHTYMYTHSTFAAHAHPTTFVPRPFGFPHDGDGTGTHSHKTQAQMNQTTCVIGWAHVLGLGRKAAGYYNWWWVACRQKSGNRYRRRRYRWVGGISGARIPRLIR